MQVLIAFDGSPCSEAAIDDLAKAGLPQIGDALLFGVAEVWLPPPSHHDFSEERSDPIIETLIRENQQEVSRFESIIETASKRFQSRYPAWNVNSEATYGSPAWEIIARAESYGADLIVVGSHGYSALSRSVLGSISQKVLSEASSSVRIARGRIDVEPSMIRLVVGYDGSDGSEAAIDTVIQRTWPEGTEVRLLTVGEPFAPTLAGDLIHPLIPRYEEFHYAQTRIGKALEERLGRLRSKGLSASFTILQGKAKHILLDESEKWNADCIFVGSHRYESALERIFLGSTASAIAARAHCSVEAVRKKDD